MKSPCPHVSASTETCPSSHEAIRYRPRPASAWSFWPQFAWETVFKQVILIGTIVRLSLWSLGIARARGAQAYTDPALTPVRDDEEETLDLLTQTGGARAADADILEWERQEKIRLARVAELQASRACL